MQEFKTIEDKLKNAINGKLLSNALDFVAFLRKNNVTQTGIDAIHYMDECICYIDTHDQSYTIWLAGDFRNDQCGFPLDETVKELAWSHANECGNCDDCENKPGKVATIFGRNFINICNGAYVDIKAYNPNIETLECFKKLLEYRIFNISNNISA